MNPLSLKIKSFNPLIGISIKKHKTIILQNWHYWSTIITSILLIVSALRCQYYYNIQLEPNSIGYIFNFLAKSEPLVTITELLLSSGILYQRKKVQNLVKTVVDLSTSETNRHAFVVFVFNVIMLVTLQTFVFCLCARDDVRAQVKIDSVVYDVQITIRTAHLLFVTLCLTVINFNLEKWKEEFARNDERSYQKLINVSEFYSTFSDLFYFLMKINIVHCFYGVLLGLKRIEDTLQRSPDDYHAKFDSIIIYLNLYDLPMILIICHAGQIFQEKIQSVFEMINVPHLDLKTPRRLSMSYYVQFRMEYQLILNYKTVFHSCAQILTYFLITLQFCDLLEVH